MAIISGNTYNHFISNYIAQEKTQSDTHKKSELRNVYKSIAKLNKESPLFLLNKDDTVSNQDAVEVKEKAHALQSKIETLRAEKDTAQIQRKAYTTSEDTVSAEYIGNNEQEASSFYINVDKLATNQINTGNYIKDKLVDLDEGQYAFELRFRGQSYEFQYSIHDDDTNLDVQERLTRLINKAGIGLAARITEDDSGNNAINIISPDTGIGIDNPRQFEITESDSVETKGAIEYFGLNNMSQEPSNAHFTLNGTEHSAFSNRFTVANEFDISLHNINTTGEDIFVGVKNDSQALIDSLSKLADSYNSFLDTAANIENSKFNSNKLIGEASSIARKHLSGMDEYGITINDTGYIEIDTEKLDNLVNNSQTGPPEELSNSIFDFVSSLTDKTKEISLDPMKYIERPIVNYKNPSSTENPSPYITSEYSGMMFNNYC